METSNGSPETAKPLPERKTGFPVTVTSPRESLTFLPERRTVSGETVVVFREMTAGSAKREAGRARQPDRRPAQVLLRGSNHIYQDRVSTSEPTGLQRRN